VEKLFTALTHAVDGAPAMALGASALWGVLSILLSPCHLSTLPLLIGYVDGQGRISTRRAFVISLLFALGIMVSIAAIALATAAAGRLLGDLGRWTNYVVAAMLFLSGLHLLGVISLPGPSPCEAGSRRKGYWGALLLGLVFGIVLGPCTFAFMAPMLGVTLKLGASAPVYGALLLAAFGAGRSVVIVAAGTFVGMVQNYLDWNEHSKGAAVVRKACGVLVIAGGAYLVWRA
jgi:cytochrome c-type biogenesis protein